jgi:hypothetical protein
MMIARLYHLGHDQRGTTTIEFTIVVFLFLLLTFGLVEFGNMFWQYNSAAKAAQLGARLAAVSNPVWGELPNLESTGTPGSAWEVDYTVSCDGDSEDCDGTFTGDYDDVAMDCLVFGRSESDPPCDTECNPAGIDAGEAGMCDRFGRIAPENVIVTYSHTGLGFAGRPGGPVPTITLQLTGLQFEFLALGDLLDLPPITMPPFTVTMTGEDLSRLAP